MQMRFNRLSFSIYFIHIWIIFDLSILIKVTGWPIVDSTSAFPKDHAVCARRDSDGCTIYVGSIAS